MLMGIANSNRYKYDPNPGEPFNKPAIYDKQWDIYFPLTRRETFLQERLEFHNFMRPSMTFCLHYGENGMLSLDKLYVIETVTREREVSM